jgi:hypothetical protein
MILKDGENNRHFRRMYGQSKKFLMDFYNTILLMKWRSTIVGMFGLMQLTFLFFAFIWYVVFLHRKRAERIDKMYNLTGFHESSNEELWKRGTNEFVPCAIGVHNFLTAFQYAVESLTTIGYGVRAVTEVTKSCIIAVGNLCFACK